MFSPKLRSRVFFSVFFKNDLKMMCDNGQLMSKYGRGIVLLPGFDFVPVVKFHLRFD